MRQFCFVVLVIVVWGCNGCTTVTKADHTKQISRDEFAERWPLTVDRGTLSCSNGAVVFTVAGTPYAVNDAAAGSAYPSIDAIAIQHNAPPGSKPPGLTWLAQMGLDLC